jgi:hypothetical protein
MATGMPRRWDAALWVGAFLLSACVSGGIVTGHGEGPGGTQPATPSAGDPTPTSAQTLGDPCRSPADCSAGEQCLSEEDLGLPGGICTRDCANSACPTGFECQGFGSRWCAPSCDPEPCRPGWLCFDITLRPRCIPDCSTPSDCPDTGLCHLHSGTCGSNDRGLSRDGSACTGGQECESRVCLSALDGFPGGYCAGPCSTVVDSCPPESTCASPFGTTAGACMRRCAVPGDCRLGEGYSCVPGAAVGAADDVCLPPP